MLSTGKCVNFQFRISRFDGTYTQRASQSRIGSGSRITKMRKPLQEARRAIPRVLNPPIESGDVANKFSKRRPRFCESGEGVRLLCDCAGPWWLRLPGQTLRPPDAGLNWGNFRRTWAHLCPSPVYFERLVGLTRFAAATVLVGVSRSWCVTQYAEHLKSRRDKINRWIIFAEEAPRLLD